MKKIFFFGTPEIAVPSLQAIHNDPNYEIVGVGVFPDRAVGRKQILTPCAVKSAAEKLKLPIYELANKDELTDLVLNEFPKLNVELAIVIAFGMIFPRKIFTESSVELINLHFSLLPEWRGASPVQAAILNGQTQTGITWQRMVPALDAGDVLMQRTYDITGKTTAEVWADFAEKSAENFSEFLDQYFAGDLIPKTQTENQATFCGKFAKSDGRVDPTTETATTIWNKWRAFTPWPGIFIETDIGPVKIIECAIGTENSLLCADQTSLAIQTIQPAGKPKMDINSFRNGYPQFDDWFQ